MASASRTKNPEVGRAATKKSKSIIGGHTLSLSDIHGNGIRLLVL